MWLNIDFEAYEKIKVLVIFFALPDNFGLRFTLAFRKDLEPRLRMRFSFLVNLNKKAVLVKTTFQNMANFQNLTPRIFKISFFMKFKTSSTSHPHYSTEPKNMFYESLRDTWALEGLRSFTVLAGKF